MVAKEVQDPKRTIPKGHLYGLGTLVALGVKPGETTADGRFTLSTVECLGSCGTAPVVMVNERYHELQDAQSLDALIEGLKQS